MTAHRALTASEFGPGRLGPGALEGRTVLVAGGAGAVGNAAIQLARWSGATVISTVSSPEKAALAVAAGAHHTIDYRRADVVEEVRALCPGGVDIAVEVAPAQNIAADVEVVKVHGLVSIYANNGGDEMTMALRACRCAAWASTWCSSGRPARRCSTLGMRLFMRVPLPAAMMRMSIGVMKM